MPATSNLEELLFEDPAANCFALLDGASIPDLLAQLDSHEPEHVCLYRGDLDHGIDAVAPYLVALEPGKSFAQWVLENGWGQHYGVFVQSTEAMLAVRLHLRRGLRVYMEDGKAMLFRYYDPRVLRVFLPTMTPEEAKTFFGPVQAFFCEDEDPARVLRFTLREGKVAQFSRGLESPTEEWKPVTE